MRLIPKYRQYLRPTVSRMLLVGSMFAKNEVERNTAEAVEKMGCGLTSTERRYES
jgi:hypothetical protein